MQIKQNYLAQHITKRNFALYWLAGQDTYLIEESLRTIKEYIKTHNDCDEKVISVQSPEDWRIIPEEANNYSLFSETTILNIYYDKKCVLTIN